MSCSRPWNVITPSLSTRFHLLPYLCPCMESLIFIFLAIMWCSPTFPFSSFSNNNNIIGNNFSHSCLGMSFAIRFSPMGGHLVLGTRTTAALTFKHTCQTHEVSLVLPAAADRRMAARAYCHRTSLLGILAVPHHPRMV